MASLHSLAVVFSSLSCSVCTPFVICNGFPSSAFLYVLATSFLFLIKEIKLINFLRTSPAHLFQPGYTWHMQHVAAAQSVTQFRCVFLCPLISQARSRLSSTGLWPDALNKLIVLSVHLNKIFSHQILYFTCFSGTVNIKINY